MSTSRRDFIRRSGMVAMGAGLMMPADEIFAQASEGAKDYEKNRIDPERRKPTLVTIFLRGGCDALHAFVPIADGKYYEMRPNIAIPYKKGEGKDSAHRIGKSEYWGLNPHMASFMPMLKSGMAAAMMNVGSPHGTRSHFSAQDYMERAAPGNDRVTQGWLNRYLEATRKPYDQPLRGLSAMSLLPRSLRGSYPVLAGNNKTEQMDMFEELYAPQNLVNMTARDGADIQKGSRLDDRPKNADQRIEDKRERNSDVARDIITESGKNAAERIRALEQARKIAGYEQYPGGALGNQLKAIAQVIKADVGLEVAQADYGGWDHHTDQGGIHGRASNMLGHVSDCLAAFASDLGQKMDKTLVLVMSEFGRTLHENGNNGTDHGRGGMMIAVGGMVRGGRIYGEWNGFEDANYGRFQPVHTDFRTVFAEAVSKLYRVDPFRMNLFPGYKGGVRDYLNYLDQIDETG